MTPRTSSAATGASITITVAAYQAPLLPPGSMAAVPLIREQVHRCESRGVAILCCPEAVLGGLADYAEDPRAFALDVSAIRLQETLAPLASDTVTTIVGFTEIDPNGRLYNAAAVFHRGAVAGVYRKAHPAIRRSVYDTGAATPIFTIDALTFGIIICGDSRHEEPARSLVARGASILFVPTNNGMPPAKGGPELIDEAQCLDMARAAASGVAVVRADVAGTAGTLVSFGSSAIVNRHGVVIRTSRRLVPDLIVADIETAGS